MDEAVTSEVVALRMGLSGLMVLMDLIGPHAVLGRAVRQVANEIGKHLEPLIQAIRPGDEVWIELRIRREPGDTAEAPVAGIIGRS